MRIRITLIYEFNVKDEAIQEYFPNMSEDQILQDYADNYDPDPHDFVSAKAEKVG